MYLYNTLQLKVTDHGPLCTKNQNSNNIAVAQYIALQQTRYTWAGSGKCRLMPCQP